MLDPLLRPLRMTQNPSSSTDVLQLSHHQPTIMKPIAKLKVQKKAKVAKKVLKRIMNEIDSDGNIIGEFVIYERHF